LHALSPPHHQRPSQKVQAVFQALVLNLFFGSAPKRFTDLVFTSLRAHIASFFGSSLIAVLMRVVLDLSLLLRAHKGNLTIGFLITFLTKIFFSKRVIFPLNT
jgi:hypothetical protein